jgi:geranylgeranyl reductase family protein
MNADLIVVGAGPAGSACATAAASAGRRVLLLERATFPRPKVCGDCLNPSAWASLDALGATDAVRALPHAELRRFRLRAPSGRRFEETLAPGEIGVRRDLLDAALLERARGAGAETRTGCTVTALHRADGAWRVATSGGTFAAPAVVAADGRNSSVARALGCLPEPARDRVAIQSHLEGADDGTVEIRLTPWGYCGLAPVGGNRVNACLVGRSRDLGAMKAWAESTLAASPQTRWQTIAPLARRDASPAPGGLFFAGDAFRVVEPLTGEGIRYALASGILAARRALGHLSPAEHRAALARLYRPTLWINRIARAAVTSPRAAEALLALFALCPPALRLLTAKVVPARPR